MNFTDWKKEHVAHGGDTEESACRALAEAEGIPLWDEEGTKVILPPYGRGGSGEDPVVEVDHYAQTQDLSAKCDSSTLQQKMNIATTQEETEKACKEWQKSIRPSQQR